MGTTLDELEVLKAVVTRLEKGSIPYMLTGSTAGNFYSQPRMTRDIDIVIDVQAGQAERLYQLFKDDFYVEKRAIEEAIRDRSTFNVIHNEKVLKVDLMVMKEGEYRKTEFSRRRKQKVNGITVFIVSPEDLILSKLCWAKDSLSQIQLRDVRNIFLFNKNDLDYDYLRKWAGKLSVLQLLEKTIA